MLVAVPTFHDRVAPAFDFCQRVTLWSLDERGCRLVGTRCCSHLGSGERAAKLQAMGAQMLLCGAIGGPVVEDLQSRGILVRSGLSGNVVEIVAALACGALDDVRFQMPGGGGPDAGVTQHVGGGPCGVNKRAES
jgi:predicted Fe-Mo cluster-binding NifX family protein